MGEEPYRSYNVSYSNHSPLAEAATNIPPALPVQEGEAVMPVPPTAVEIAAQIAALCWRFNKGRVQVLLVTSRETRRWVLPKGWPITGLIPAAAAAREAWEEAGVEGKVCATAIGSYTYDKILPNRDALACAVAVFPLRVEFLKSHFPEQKERRRKWFSAEDASHLVAEPELADLLTRVSQTPQQLSPKALDYQSVARKSGALKTSAPKASAPKSDAAEDAAEDAVKPS